MENEIKIAASFVVKQFQNPYLKGVFKKFTKTFHFKINSSFISAFCEILEAP